MAAARLLVAQCRSAAGRGWEAIEALEIAAAQGRRAQQVKVAERELLLAAALVTLNPKK
jgi:hypothetical protein